MQSSATAAGEEVVGLVDGEPERDVQPVVGHDLAPVEPHGPVERGELRVVGRGAARRVAGRSPKYRSTSGEPVLRR